MARSPDPQGIFRATRHPVGHWSRAQFTEPERCVKNMDERMILVSDGLGLTSGAYEPGHRCAGQYR